MEKYDYSIKSPLRYPGGKSRALKRIIPLIPDYEEFREPMVGGGSVFFALKQTFPNKKYWINDINTDLYLFWKYCKENPKNLIREIKKLKTTYSSGRELHKELSINADKFKGIRRAARFFILNRITFSGLTESGGYSEEAYKKRFTESSIKRIRSASKVLKNVKITNLDYLPVIKMRGKNAFIFLDPPYVSVKAKLYGKKGDLQSNFDHAQFAVDIKHSKHKWLITYDNCTSVQELFRFKKSFGLKIKEWKLRYGTNNSKSGEARIGRELFILNYKISPFKQNKKLYSNRE